MKIKLQDIQKDKAGQYIILAWEKKYVTPKRMSNIPSKENEGANVAVRAAEEIVNGRDNAVQAWAGTAYRTADNIAQSNKLLGKSREYMQYKPKMLTQGYGYKVAKNPSLQQELVNPATDAAITATRAAERINSDSADATQSAAGLAYRTAEAAPEDKPNLLEATKENINEMRTENYPIFKAEREARFAVPKPIPTITFGSPKLTPEEVAKKAAKLAFPKRRLTIN